MWRALQRMDRRFENGSKALRALEQAFVAIDVEGRKRGGAGERMRRIGVTVKQFDAGARRRCMKASWIFSETITPPIGTAPLVTPFANVIMSGVTP